MKKTIQKIIAVILSITGMATSFVGCGNSSNQKEETTTSIVETTTDVVEEKTLLDDVKYDEVRDEIKTIQEGLHIPDKYMEIPEVLDLITANLKFKKYEKYEFITGTTSNLDKISQYYYSKQYNMLYSENRDCLRIVNIINDETTLTEINFSNDKYYIYQSVCYDLNGNPIDKTYQSGDNIYFDTGVTNDFVKYGSDITRGSKRWCYSNAGHIYTIYISNWYIEMEKSFESNNKIEEICYEPLEETEESISYYNEKAACAKKYFSDRDAVSMLKLADDYSKNNKNLSYYYHEQKGELASYSVEYIVETNGCLRCAVNKYSHSTDSSEINEFNAEISPEERDVLIKYINSGECEVVIKYIKQLEEKYGIKEVTTDYVKTYSKN